MSSIIFKNKSHSGITLLQNQFIDNYMMNANGEFVKIYIYILRCLGDPAHSANLTVVDFADIFACTENDILRALKYWENAGLIQLGFENGTLKSIEVNDLSAKTKSGHTTESAVTVISTESASTAKTVSQNTASSPELSTLVNNPEIKQILGVAQQYIGKTLSSSETNILLYIYDELSFSFDLIDYLLEYCASNGHRELRYIEKVAIAWHEAGITTVTRAKDYTSSFSNTYFSIMKAFGIANRLPAQPEKDVIEKWTHVYGFSLDVILAACNKTIDTIHQPSFKYADSILSKWKQKGVKSIPDIQRLDTIHENQKSINAANAASNANATVKKTGFNNFPQRTDIDMNELEKALLNRN